jgi:hypothetical protein
MRASVSDPRLAAAADGAVATAVATYTRRSTDEEHQRFSIEMQDDRLGKYVSSQDSWHLATPRTRTTSPAPPWTARACSGSCAMRGRDASQCCSSTESIASRVVRGLVHILNFRGGSNTKIWLTREFLIRTFRTYGIASRICSRRSITQRAH